MDESNRIAHLMRTQVRELVDLDPVKWDETFSGLHGDDLRLLSNSLIQLAIKAARMSAYIDARGGEHHKDLGHPEAVRTQNEVAEKIRVVFHFQQAKCDIDF